MRNKVLKSSTHALLPCGAWLTLSHMERTFHPPLDHTTSERSLKRTLPGKAPQFNNKLLPLRQPHHDRQDGAQIY